MNSSKGNRSFYLMLLGGCAFFIALFLVKIFKNLANVSITEIATVFLLVVSAGICKSLLNDKSRVSDKSTDKAFAEGGSR